MLEINLSDSEINLLYAIRAGMAAKRPIAVAIKASDIPGATADKVACEAPARPLKEFMMPQTDPKSPM